MKSRNTLDVSNRIQSQIKGMGKEGCLFRVIRSSLPEDIGLEGIVLLETKNQFTIITKKNCIRKINKRDHVFQVLGVSSRIIGIKLIDRTRFVIGFFLMFTFGL